GGGNPILLTGLANGVTYSFTVTATNIAGTGPPSASSNSVTPSGPTVPTASGVGGGGGSGGGGGGGGGPRFHVSVGGPSGQVTVGGTVTLIVDISNPAGNADAATLHVSGSGLQLVSAKVDRGSGCTADGPGASCVLDFFNSGLSASEELTFRV